MLLYKTTTKPGGFGSCYPQDKKPKDRRNQIEDSPEANEAGQFLETEIENTDFA